MDTVWSGTLLHKGKVITKISVKTSWPLPSPLGDTLELNQKMTQDNFIGKVLPRAIVSGQQTLTINMPDLEEKTAIQVGIVEPEAEKDSNIWNKFATFLSKSKSVAVSTLEGRGGHLFMAPMTSTGGPLDSLLDSVKREMNGQTMCIIFLWDTAALRLFKLPAIWEDYIKGPTKIDAVNNSSVGTKDDKDAVELQLAKAGLLTSTVVTSQSQTVVQDVTVPASTAAMATPTTAVTYTGTNATHSKHDNSRTADTSEKSSTVLDALPGVWPPVSSLMKRRRSSSVKSTDVGTNSVSKDEESREPVEESREPVANSMVIDGENKTLASSKEQDVVQLTVTSQSDGYANNAGLCDTPEDVAFSNVENTCEVEANEINSSADAQWSADTNNKLDLAKSDENQNHDRLSDTSDFVTSNVGHTRNTCETVEDARLSFEKNIPSDLPISEENTTNDQLCEPSDVAISNDEHCGDTHEVKDGELNSLIDAQLGVDKNCTLELHRSDENTNKDVLHEPSDIAVPNVAHTAKTCVPVVNTSNANSEKTKNVDSSSIVTDDQKKHAAINDESNILKTENTQTKVRIATSDEPMSPTNIFISHFDKVIRKKGKSKRVPHCTATPEIKGLSSSLLKIAPVLESNKELKTKTSIPAETKPKRRKSTRKEVQSGFLNMKNHDSSESGMDKHNSSLYTPKFQGRNVTLDSSSKLTSTITRTVHNFTSLSSKSNSENMIKEGEQLLPKNEDAGQNGGSDVKNGNDQSDPGVNNNVGTEQDSGADAPAPPVADVNCIEEHIEDPQALMENVVDSSEQNQPVPVTDDNAHKQAMQSVLQVIPRDIAPDTLSHSTSVQSSLPIPAPVATSTYASGDLLIICPQTSSPYSNHIGSFNLPNGTLITSNAKPRDVPPDVHPVTPKGNLPNGTLITSDAKPSDVPADMHIPVTPKGEESVLFTESLIGSLSVLRDALNHTNWAREKCASIVESIMELLASRRCRERREQEALTMVYQLKSEYDSAKKTDDGVCISGYAPGRKNFMSIGTIVAKLENDVDNAHQVSGSGGISDNHGQANDSRQDIQMERITHSQANDSRQDIQMESITAMIEKAKAELLATTREEILHSLQVQNEANKNKESRKRSKSGKPKNHDDQERGSPAQKKKRIESPIRGNNDRANTKKKPVVSKTVTKAFSYHSSVSRTANKFRSTLQRRENNSSSLSFPDLPLRPVGDPKKHFNAVKDFVGIKSKASDYLQYLWHTAYTVASASNLNDPGLTQNILQCVTGIKAQKEGFEHKYPSKLHGKRYREGLLYSEFNALHSLFHLYKSRCLANEWLNKDFNLATKQRLQFIKTKLLDQENFLKQCKTFLQASLRWKRMTDDERPLFYRAMNEGNKLEGELKEKLRQCEKYQKMIDDQPVGPRTPPGSPPRYSGHAGDLEDFNFDSNVKEEQVESNMYGKWGRDTPVRDENPEMSSPEKISHRANSPPRKASMDRKSDSNSNNTTEHARNPSISNTLKLSNDRRRSHSPSQSSDRNRSKSKQRTSSSKDHRQSRSPKRSRSSVSPTSQKHQEKAKSVRSRSRQNSKSPSRRTTSSKSNRNSSQPNHPRRRSSTATDKSYSPARSARNVDNSPLRSNVSSMYRTSITPEKDYVTSRAVSPASRFVMNPDDISNKNTGDNFHRKSNDISDNYTHLRDSKYRGRYDGSPMERYSDSPTMGRSAYIDDGQDQRWSSQSSGRTLSPRGRDTGLSPRGGRDISPRERASWNDGFGSDTFSSRGNLSPRMRRGSPRRSASRIWSPRSGSRSPVRTSVFERLDNSKSDIQDKRSFNPSHPLYKTVLCRNWSQDGQCRLGSACNYAHGEDELRPVPPSKPVRTTNDSKWKSTFSPRR